MELEESMLVLDSNQMFHKICSLWTHLTKPDNGPLIININTTTV